MSNIKILYIITQADGGGAQKYVLALAKHFRGEIAAGDEATELFEDARLAGLTVHPLSHLKREINPWHDLLAVWEIRELIKKLEPDIVHLNSTKAGVLGSFASIGLKAKVVFTAHGFRFNEPLSLPAKQFYLALEKVACSYRDFIIAVSDADRSSALAYKLISPDKIKTIHNGIGPIDFLTKDAARKSLGLPMDKKIIGVIANNYATKGIDNIKKEITIFPIKGTMLAVIGNTFNELQFDENIKDLGYKENASKYLKAFDVLAIPSKKEGFPYVALEGLQAGLPIVATRVGGLPEALSNAGKFVDTKNPGELSQASASIVTDDMLRSKMSELAFERSKLFSEQKMLSETEKIYEQILKDL